MDTHIFLALLRVRINDRFLFQEIEYVSCGHLGFRCVWSEGTGLSQSHGSKHNGTKYPEREEKFQKMLNTIWHQM